MNSSVSKNQTPRTDAEQDAHGICENNAYIHSNFARQLERELNASLAYGKDAKQIAIRWYDNGKADVERLTQERDAAKAELATYKAEWSEDKPLPEDSVIAAAHPVNTGDHETFQRAARLVGAKHSKYALIGLVNWLLRASKTEIAKEAN